MYGQAMIHSASRMILRVWRTSGRLLARTHTDFRRAAGSSANPGVSPPAGRTHCAVTEAPLDLRPRQGARLIAALVFLAACFPLPAVSLVLDDFSAVIPYDTGVVCDASPTDRCNLSLVGAGETTKTGPVTADAGIIGGEREVRLDRLSGSGAINTTVAGGFFEVSANSENGGEAILTWDGATGLPPGFTATDLTAGGHTALKLSLATVIAPAEIIIEVFSDAGNSSRAVLSPASASVPPQRDVYFSYAHDFVPNLGSGADFSSVVAVTMRIRLPETTANRQVQIDLFETVKANLSASMTDLTTANAEWDTTAVTPGGTIRYRLTITNNGGEATNVDVSDTLPAGLTLVSGSIKTSPTAGSDGYEATGNVRLSVAAGSGLLGNDNDPDGGTVTLDTGSSDTTSAQGGSISYNGTTGAFDYDPPPGFTGVDSFSYQIMDDEAQTASATVNILVDGLAWFVDDTHCTPQPCGSGTLADPFGGFHPTQLNGASGAGDLDGPNDIIYVRTGSGSTDTGTANGFELEDGQQLLGEGVALMVGGNTLVTAGSRPTLTNLDSDGGGSDVAGDGLTLATDNTIRGLDLGDVPAANTRLRGTSVGTLTIDTLDMASTGGVVSITAGGTLAVSLDGIVSTASSGTPAVNLSGVGGTFTVTNGAGTDTDIAGADAGIAINGAVGAAAFSFGDTLVTTSAPTGAGNGVDLASSASATFDFASLDITTANGHCLTTDTAGTLNLGGTTNTFNATGGAAITANATSVGSGWTFDGLTSTTSSDAGVDLSSLTGSGGVTVSGNVTVNQAVNQGVQLNGNSVAFTVSGTTNLGVTTGNGGQGIEIDGSGDASFGVVNIDNRSALGIDIAGASGTIGFGNTTIGNSASNASSGIAVTGTTGGSITFTEADVDQNSVAAPAIAANSNAGSLTFTTMDIDNVGGDAVSLSGNSGAVAINGGSIDNTSAGGDGIKSINTPLTVDFALIGGSAAIAGDGIEIVNSDAGNRSVTIQNSNIGIGAPVLAGRGIFINASGSGTLTASLTGNAIASTNQTILTNDGGTAGSLVLDLQNSTLTTTAASTFTQEHVGSGLNSTIVRTWSSPNQVIGSPSGSGGIFFNRITFDASGTSLSGTQVVVSGAVEIGQVAGRVQGDGLSLVNPSGDLSIPTLNIFNNAGTGLEVDTKGLGTTFNLATGAGTIDTTGGPAMFLDPLTTALTLGTVVSSASTGAGVIFDAVGGTVNVASIDVDNAAGDGLTVKDSGGTFTFTTVSVDGTTGDGVFLNNNTGSVSINGGAIGASNDPAANSVDIDGGNANVTIAATVTKASAGEVVEVTSRTGGTVDFTQAITCNSGCTGVNFSGNSGGSTSFSHTTKTLNTGANTALTVSANAGHTINFTGGGLDIDTSSATGIDADNGGAINISGAGNTITVTGGPAVDINNSTTGMSFASLSVTNSTSRGIDLTSLGASSSFAVSGTTGINGTTNEGINIHTTGAGTDLDFAAVNIDNRGDTGILLNGIQGDLDFGATSIPNQNNAGGYGIRCDNTSAPVTFASTTISNANETVAETDPGSDLLPDNEGDGDGIFLNNNSGSFTINGGSISNVDGDGIDARTLSDSLSVTGLTITTPGQHAFRGIFLTGTHSFTNSTFTQVNNANTYGALLLNTNTTLGGMTFDNCDFHTSSTGVPILFMGTRGSGNMTLNVQNGSEFYALVGEAIMTIAGDDTGATGDVNTNISNTTFRDASGASGANSIFIGSAETAATNTVNVSGNTFSNIKVSTTPLGNESVVRFQTNGGALNGTISGNTVHNTNGRRNGIGIVSEPPVGKTASIDLTLDNNDIDDIDAFQFEGLFISLRDRTTDSNLRITNNDIGQKVGSEGDVDRGIFLQTRDDSGIAPFTLNVLLHNNNLSMDSSSSDDVVGVDAEDGTTMNLTVTANTFNHSNASAQSFDAEAEHAPSTICLDMNASGAMATENTANREIEVERDNGATYRIEGLGANSAAAAVATFLNNNNNFTGTVTALDDGGLFLDEAGCPTPP